MEIEGNFFLDTLPIEIKISGTGGEELPQVLQARGNFALRCLRKEAKVSPREPFAYVKYNSTHGNRKVPYPFQSYQTIIKQERSFKDIIFNHIFYLNKLPISALN